MKLFIEILVIGMLTFGIYLSGQSQGLPPDWEYSQTPINHIISVPLSCEPNINGVLLNPGDYIGVFFTDGSGKLACGGASEWLGNANTGIIAFGDDSFTGIKEGFSSGENITYKYYSWSVQKEYDAEVICNNNLPDSCSNFISNGLSGIDTTWANGFYIVASAFPEEICSGDNTQLLVETSGGSGNYSYSWTSEPSGFTSIIANPISSPEINTTFFIAIQDVDDILITNILVEVLPQPISYAGVDQTVCEDDAIELFGMSTNSWDCHWLSTGSGTFADVNNPETAYYPSSGDIQNGECTLCLICQAISPCVSSRMDCIDITIHQNPTVYAGANAAICKGDSYTIDDANSEFYSSINWTGGPGTFDDPTIVNPTYTPAIDEYGTIVLCMEASPISPCNVSLDDCMDLFIQAPPYIEPLMDAVICEGDAFCVDLIGSDYLFLLWSSSGTGTFNDVFSSNSCYYPGIEDINAGSVEICSTILPIDPCSIELEECFMLSIQKLPIVDAGPDITFCEDVASCPINGSSSNSTFCVWNGQGGGSFTDPYSLNTDYFPSIGDIENGSVTLCLTCQPEEPCVFMGEDCMIITFTQKPKINLPIEVSVCETDNLYCVGFAEIDNYSSLLWETLGDGTFDNPGIEYPCYTFGENDLANGDAALFLTAEPLPGCDDPVTEWLTIMIFSEPLIDAGEDKTVCAGEGIIISDASVNDGIAWVWNGGLGSFNDNTILSPTYFPDASEVGSFVTLCFNAMAIDPCFGVASDCLELYVQPKALVNSGEDITICEGQDVMLEGFSQNSSSCNWLSSGSGYFTNSSNLSTTYVPSFMDITEGEVNLCLICESIEPCTTEVISCLNVSIIPLPIVEIGMGESICEGDVFSIMPPFIENVSGVIWSTFGDGFFDDATNVSPIYYPGDLDVEFGQVELCLEGFPVSPCENSVQSCMTLIILKNPEVYAGADATICEDQAYCIQDAFVNNYFDIIWYASEGSFDNPNIPNPCYFTPPEFFMPGMVLISVEAQPEFPCSVMAYDDLELTIMENPEVFVGEDLTICEGQTVEVFGSGIMASSILWQSLGTGTFDNPANDFTTYYPSELDIQDGGVGLCFNAEPIFPCALFATDCLYVEIRKNATADAGQDVYLSEGSLAELSGDAFEFIFSIWETSGDGMFDDELQLTTTYQPGPADISNNHATITLFAQSISPCEAIISDSLELFIGKEHNIYLNAGWNGISTYLSPFNQDLESLMSPIQNQLVIMQSFTQLFWPGYNINTIGNFDSNQGYSIKVNSNTTLSIIGSEPESATFTFNQGWNIMPVLTNCEFPAFDFLLEMGSSFNIAYEIGGNGILWPAQGIYNILSFEPGKAYMVKTNQEKTITYPECETSFKERIIPQLVPAIENSPWQIPSASPGYHIIGLNPESKENNFQPGDLIGAFTATGVCAGITEIQKSPTALLVNPDDFTIPEIDGFMESEPFHFKLFNPASGSVSSLSISFDDAYQDCNGKFKVNGISVISSANITNEGAFPDFNDQVSIYPNPSNGIFNISGINGNSDVGLKVINVHGETILNKIVDKSCKFDISSQPKGIFLVRLEFKNSVSNFKVILE